MDQTEAVRPVQRHFPQFALLHEDLMIHILSFVAYAPMELPHSQPRSTLTGTLPFVSKQIRGFCGRDYFWRVALQRLLANDPYLWEEGLLRRLPKSTEPPANLLEHAHKVLCESFQSIFRGIYNSHIRFTGPVFYMTGAVRLGNAFGLHFFEPRYRFLIAEVMRDWPDEARLGEHIQALPDGRFPTFVYAHTAPLAPTSPACLVQVKNCVIHGDGTADVMLLPVAYVWLERLWERTGTGRLNYAQCLRMGRQASRQMEICSGSVENDLMRFLAQNSMQSMLSYLLSRRVEDGESSEEEREENDTSS